MAIDLSDPKVYETNDFSNMKIIDYDGRKLFYMDNFYKYPELVFESFNRFTPPVWKEWEKPSKNMVDFEDRRHQIDHDGMVEIYKKLYEISGQIPSDGDTSVVTNYTRFKKCPQNNYIDNYWWPHHDCGYNGIIYFNDFNGEEYEGTNIYSAVDENYANSHQKPEHQDPWTPKDEWEIIIKIKAKYNRFVMFDGSKYWHGMSLFDDRWFADAFENANFRINQVIFLQDN